MPTHERASITLDPAHLPRPRRYDLRKRLYWAAAAMALLLLLALVPPLVNVNRFQRRIASSISGSLGRPVHLDRVHIVLFPLPGFSLENVVVSEIPPYGAEPVMRSNVVHATLRLSSLWRGKLEFSTISLEEPSVNLVRNAAGEWNIQGILMQAARIPSAPTEQASAGPAPRFPYIEATNARVNLKLRDQKTPFSLTSAEFALWQPDPGKWQLRLQAHPARTDTDASDTGILHVEATTGKSPSFNGVPMEMQADWKTTSLGEASKLFMKGDAGWRGAIVATLVMHGTLGQATIESDLQLTDVRRADFVPARSLQIHAHCSANELGLHALDSINCSIPLEPLEKDPGSQVAKGRSGPAKEGSITLTGNVPNINDSSLSDLRFAIANVDSDYAVDMLRLFSARIPTALSSSGIITGDFHRSPHSQRDTDATSWSGNAGCRCLLMLPYTAIAKAARAHTATQTWTLPVTIALSHNSSPQASLTIMPDMAGAGGDSLGIQRAIATGTAAMPSGERLEIQLGLSGYRLQTSESSPPPFLGEIVRRFPPLGDGLAQATVNLPIAMQRFHYVSERTWNNPPTWSIGDGSRR